MGKKLVLLSLLACWPGLASLVSLVPLSGSEAMGVESRPEGFASYSGPLGFTFASQASFAQDSLLRRDLNEFYTNLGLLPDAEGIASLAPRQSLSADDDFENTPSSLSGEASPGKVVFLVIILVGAIVRFFTSATFRDFMMDVASPLAPY